MEKKEIDGRFFYMPSSVQEMMEEEDHLPAKSKILLDGISLEYVGFYNPRATASECWKVSDAKTETILNWPLLGVLPNRSLGVTDEMLQAGKFYVHFLELEKRSAEIVIVRVLRSRGGKVTKAHSKFWGLLPSFGFAR